MGYVITTQIILKRFVFIIYEYLDGGDCNQLCDYDQCNITQTIYGECIDGCNTADCDYGFGEQCLNNTILYYQTYDNYALCTANTDCYYDSELGVTWIGM